MKKFLKLTALLLIGAAFTFALASCSSNDDDDEEGGKPAVGGDITDAVKTGNSSSLEFKGTNGWDNFVIYELKGDELSKLKSVAITCYDTPDDDSNEAGGNTWLTKDKDNVWGNNDANVVSNKEGIGKESKEYVLTPEGVEGLSSVWLCVQNGAHPSSGWDGKPGKVTVEKVVLNLNKD